MSRGGRACGAVARDEARDGALEWACPPGTGADRGRARRAADALLLPGSGGVAGRTSAGFRGLSGPMEGMGDSTTLMQGNKGQRTEEGRGVSIARMAWRMGHAMTVGPGARHALLHTSPARPHGCTSQSARECNCADSGRQGRP